MSAEDSPPIHYELENGLKVILLKDSRQPLVAIRATVGTGSAHDPLNRPGLMHLTEHLAFGPTAHIPESLLRTTAKLGALTRNGVTHSTQTIYFETVPARRLPQALWLESERFGYLVPHITAKELRKEKEIVLREISSRTGPSTHHERHLNRFLYPKGHPYRQDSLLDQSPGSATLEDVLAYYQLTHRPDNLILSVCGDFDIEQARSLILKYLGPLKNPSLPRRAIKIPDPEPPSELEREILISTSGNHLILNWFLPQTLTLRRELALLLQAYQLNAALHEWLIDKKRLAIDVSVNVARRLGPTSLRAEVSLTRSDPPEDTWAIAKKVAIAAVSSPKTLLLFRTRLALDLVTEDDDLQERAHRATLELATYGRVTTLKERLATLDALTVADLERELHSLLHKEDLRSIIFYHGGDSLDGELYR